jgi:predicted TPR repeat methyltransferase
MTMLAAHADKDVLMRKIDEFLDKGRLGPARTLIAAMQRKSVEPRRLGTLAARLAAREGRWQDAADELDRVLAVPPALGPARKLRADVRLHLNDVPGALADAADAVLDDPADPAAKALLGAMLIDHGQAEDAVVCLRAAIAHLAHDPVLWQALARAETAAGRPAAALAVLREGAEHLVRHPEMHTALLLALVRQRCFDEAAETGRAAAAEGLLDAVGHGLLGHALSSLDRHDEAGSAYREALKLAPEDPYVAHLVAAAGGVAGRSRAPAEYVETIFDGYASRFELHLVSLGYRVPGLLRGVLVSLAREGLLPAPGPILDLGGGTGLIGLAVGDLGLGPITGIDLSGRMLKLAEEKGLYARLEQGEAEQFLARDGTPWHLVLAGDVLCYFGALESLFATLARRLAPGGMVLFTVEAAAEEDTPRGWRLGPQARFAHTESYLRTVLAEAGLAPRLLRREILRYEAEQPVAGLLVAAGVAS